MVQNKNIAKNLLELKEFLEKLKEVQESPEEMALIEDVKKLAEEKGKRRAEAKARGQKFTEPEGIKIKKKKPYYINAKGALVQYKKVNKVEDEQNKKVNQTEGEQKEEQEKENEPIPKTTRLFIFDFSILFEESGKHAIATDEIIATGSFGQVRAAADINDLSQDIVVKTVRLFDEKQEYNKEGMQEEMKRKFEKRKRMGADKKTIKEDLKVGPFSKTELRDIQRESRKQKALGNLIGEGLVRGNKKVDLIIKRNPGIELSSGFLKSIGEEILQNLKNKRINSNEHMLKLIKAAIAITEAVQQIHEENRIHRDIKLDNFTYDASTNKAQLIDLDTMVFLNKAKRWDRQRQAGKTDYRGMKEVAGRTEPVFFAPDYPRKRMKGVIDYMAPEIQSRIRTINEDHQESYKILEQRAQYSKASDRYALGQAIHDIFVAHYYFLKDIKYFEYASLYFDKLTKEVFEEIYKLVKGLQLEEEPEKRTDLKTVLKILQEQRLRLENDLKPADLPTPETSKQEQEGPTKEPTKTGGPKP